ncbi:MAG TPA: hypothetical protein VL979_05695 [Solirubrobacteraceae bacterium]|nr:hypothetical protein [Solirubrobacteraceae bacterium]
MHDFADAVGEGAGRHGHQPSASSRAMEEIAVEAQFAARSDGWQEPIRDTHTFGGMTLTAATDFARSFAVLLDADSTPVYGHLVVARSVFDACVVAAWLNDPKADATERIKRGLCEQLYSAMELVRLRLEDDAAERRDFWKARAAALGWTVKVANNKPVIDGTSRPSVPKGLSELLVGDAEARIGRAQWSYLSSVSHVTWYGLRQAITSAAPSPAPSAGLASYGTTSSSVRAQAVCVLRALRKAADARFVFMGWADDDWRAASARAEQHEIALMQAHQQGSA